MNEAKDISIVISEFINKIDSLYEIIPFIMHISIGLSKSRKSELDEFINKFSVKTDAHEEKGGTSHVFPLEHGNLALKKIKKYKKAYIATSILPNIFVVSFVSEYDSYLGNLIKHFLKIRPEIIDTSEKNISFADLTKLGSIDSAFEHILEKEVESLLRKSHGEQFKWLEKIFNTELRKELEVWPVFIELTERRNLFVHNNGVVSNHYMEVCNHHNIGLTDDIKVGVKLDVDKHYIDTTYRCLYEIGIKLAHVLWRKIVPDERKDADSNLTLITYDLICEEKYDLAIRLLDFSVSTLKKWHSDANRRIFIVNRAQAYYHLNQKDECLRILNEEDWSSCGLNFQICAAVLRDDFQLASILMIKIGKDGSITKEQYVEWPVFKQFRECEGFNKTFIGIYGMEPVISASKQVFKKDESEYDVGVEEDIEMEDKDVDGTLN